MEKTEEEKIKKICGFFFLENYFIPFHKPVKAAPILVIGNQNPSKLPPLWRCHYLPGSRCPLVDTGFYPLL